MSQRTEHSSIKVFFSLWPSAMERSHLAAWQKPLQSLCGGRAMSGEYLHNTLVFIGNIMQHRLEPLQLAAREVSGKEFELSFDIARYWGHNHIVYAAPEHLPLPLTQLVLALEQSLASHGFKFDIREYRPHVTLIRNARWTDAPKAGNPQPASGCTKGRQSTVLQAGRGVDTAELAPPLPAMTPVRWKITDFALVQSMSHEGLAAYRVLARFPLGAAAGTGDLQRGPDR